MRCRLEEGDEGMTIILSTTRQGFAVLAADRLHGGGRPGFRPKVVLHRSLQLAFAVGGLMYLPVNGRFEDATTHLHEFCDTITSPDELVVSDLAERLRVLFQPSMELEKDKVQVFIALVNDGEADVGAQWVSASHIMDDPTHFYPDCTRYLIPNHLHDFYRTGSHLNAMNESAITSLWEVGRLAREAVQAGIDQEHNEGKHTTIGGPIDVVAVTVPFII
jgi:hypothetical protein